MWPVDAIAVFVRVGEIELGEAALQSAKEKPSGVLRLSAPMDLAHALLPGIVAAYTAKYPDVSVELVVTNRVVDLVEEGIDLAIRWAGALKDSSLVARRFIETRSNLWASPKYMQAFGKPPTHPRELAHATCITVFRTGWAGTAVDVLLRLRWPPLRPAESGEFHPDGLGTHLYIECASVSDVKWGRRPRVGSAA